MTALDVNVALVKVSMFPVNPLVVALPLVAGIVFSLMTGCSGSVLST